jgi:hypothetical protein
MLRSPCVHTLLDVVSGNPQREFQFGVQAFALLAVHALHQSAVGEVDQVGEGEGR